MTRSYTGPAGTVQSARLCSEFHPASQLVNIIFAGCGRQETDRRRVSAGTRGVEGMYVPASYAMASKCRLGAESEFIDINFF
jgi:hypothetical protein